MKKIILGASNSFCVYCSPKNLQAQVKVGVNINIGSQPVWGPVGYDYVDYYYLPDIDAYYYVPGRQFIYLSNGRWIFAASLPVAYRHYNLYSGYKVVINEPRPYLHANVFRTRYAALPKREQNIMSRISKIYRHDNGNHNGWNNMKETMVMDMETIKSLIYYRIRGSPSVTFII